MIRSTPMINTARLTLCAMRPEDFDRFAEIWRDPEVVRHVGGTPRTRGEAWDSFLRNAGHWQMTGFGQWAVVLQSNRKCDGTLQHLLGVDQSQRLWCNNGCLPQLTHIVASGDCYPPDFETSECCT